MHADIIYFNILATAHEQAVRVYFRQIRAIVADPHLGYDARLSHVQDGDRLTLSPQSKHILG